MDKILKLYTIEDLKYHLDNNTLIQLPKIGIKTEELIISYFNKTENNIISRISNITKFNINEIKGYFDNENNCKLLNYYINWLNKLRISKNNKIKIINYWLNDISRNFNEWKKINKIGINKDSINTRTLFNQNKIHIKDYWLYGPTNSNNWYTPDSIEINPMLLKEIDFKFEKIDEIALENNWWSINDYYRFECYIEFILEKCCRDNGHTYLSTNDLYIIYKNNKKDNIIINDKLFYNFIHRLIIDDKIKTIANKKYIILSDLYDKEKLISDYILNQLDMNNDIDINLSLEDIDDNTTTSEQLCAINGILSNKISLLLGGGGTGKTANVVYNTCNYILDNTKDNILFSAPTHAAKKNGKKVILDSYDILQYNNLEENQKRIFFETIQSIIFYPKNKKVKTNKLKRYLYEHNIKYIFIDEMSMVNLDDFYNLVDNLWDYEDDYMKNNGNYVNNVKLILIGDNNQLSPIGAGQPFIDIINSKKIKSFKLTTNFRAKDSDIPLFCKQVLNKENWWINKFKNIHYHFTYKWKNELYNILLDLKSKKYTPYIGNDDNEKTFQIISPINKTSSEVAPLIRKLFYNNKSNNEFSIGDYIIVKKNTYIFKNGDIGKIIDKDNNSYNYIIKLNETISKVDIELFNEHNEDHNISIDEDTQHISISTDYLKSIYCRTVHSSQGLGFSKVICILDGNIWNMLSRDLVYTSYSRAKKDLYLLGDEKYYKSNKNKELKKIDTLLSDLLNDKVEIDETKEYIPTIFEIKDTQIERNTGIKKRKSIPKKIRYEVWQKYNCSVDGSCYVCNDKLKFYNFHVGHVKSIHNGGTNSIDNLQPICQCCNLSMGVRDLEDYKKEFYTK